MLSAVNKPFMLSVVMLYDFTLCVVYAECKLALYAERLYAECHYAECHYAECCGIAIIPHTHYMIIKKLQFGAVLDKEKKFFFCAESNLGLKL
jgi:hypothetical protein